VGTDGGCGGFLVLGVVDAEACEDVQGVVPVAVGLLKLVQHVVGRVAPGNERALAEELFDLQVQVRKASEDGGNELALGLWTYGISRFGACLSRRWTGSWTAPTVLAMPTEGSAAIAIQNPCS
jgi:hypothetical protein